MKKSSQNYLESNAVFNRQVLRQQPCPRRSVAHVAAVWVDREQYRAAVLVVPDFCERDAAASSGAVFVLDVQPLRSLRVSERHRFGIVALRLCDGGVRRRSVLSFGSPGCEEAHDRNNSKHCHRWCVCATFQATAVVSITRCCVVVTLQVRALVDVRWQKVVTGGGWMSVECVGGSGNSLLTFLWKLSNRGVMRTTGNCRCNHLRAMIPRGF